MNRLLLHRALTLLLITLPFLVSFALEPPQPENSLIARMWHGKTKTEKADEYERYLRAEGISKIKAIDGNKGVQLLRKSEGDTTEFMVISYWESIDAIKKFAGEDYQKAYQLPRDPEYLLKPESVVQHFEVRLNEWKD
jgi:heme-degrading monooxygenase HmoA